MIICIAMPHNVSHVTTATGCCWVRFDDTFYQSAVSTSLVADGRVRGLELFAYLLRRVQGMAGAAVAGE